MRRAVVPVAVVAVLAGAVAAMYAAGFRVSRVRTVDVYVTAVNADRTDIGFARSAGGDVRGTYDLRALTEWADGADGEWRPVGPDVEGGVPSCIPTGSYGAHVRLYLVTAVGGGGRDLDRVVRLRCLSPPTATAAP